MTLMEAMPNFKPSDWFWFIVWNIEIIGLSLYFTKILSTYLVITPAVYILGWSVA